MSEEFAAPLQRARTASPREVSTGRNVPQTTSDDDNDIVQPQDERKTSGEKAVVVADTNDVHSNHHVNQTNSDSQANKTTAATTAPTSALVTRAATVSPPPTSSTSTTVAIPEHYRMSHRPEQAVLSLAQLRAVKELFEVYDFARSAVNPMNQSSHLKRERVRAISQAGQAKRGRGSVVVVNSSNTTSSAAAGTAKLTSIKKLRQEAERSGGVLAGAAAQAVLSASRASIQKLREEIDPDIALAPLSVRDKAQDERERRQNLFGLMQRRMQMTTREEAFSESEETMSCASHEAELHNDDNDEEPGAMMDTAHEETKAVARESEGRGVEQPQQSTSEKDGKQPLYGKTRKSRSPIVRYASNTDSNNAAATHPETEYDRRLRQDRRVLAEELKCMHEWRERAAQLQAEHGSAGAKLNTSSSSFSLTSHPTHNTTNSSGRRRSSLHDVTSQGESETEGQTITKAAASAVVMPSSAGVPLDYFTRFIVSPLFSTIFPVSSEVEAKAHSGVNEKTKDGTTTNNTSGAAVADGSTQQQQSPQLTAGFLPRRRSHRRAVRELFQKMDTNADGRVSWHEFAEFVLQEGQKQLLAQELQHAREERERSCRRQQQSQHQEYSPLRGTSPPRSNMASGRDSSGGGGELSAASSRSTSQTRQGNHESAGEGVSSRHTSTPGSARSTTSAQPSASSTANVESVGEQNASVLHYAPSFAAEPTNCSPWQAQFPLVKHLYHELPIHRLIHSTRHQRYFTASEDGLVKMWRADMNLRNTHLTNAAKPHATEAQRQGHGGATDVPTRSSMVHERNVLNTHTPITDMVLSPRSMGNAEVIAVAALDGTITLLRTATGELVRTLLGVRVETAAQVAATASACGRHARAAMMQDDDTTNVHIDEGTDYSKKGQVKEDESGKGKRPYTTYVGSRCALRHRLRSPAGRRNNNNKEETEVSEASEVTTKLKTKKSGNEEASGNVAAGCVLRVPYTVRAYHDDSIEIFFGRSNRYFQGLEVMAPTYEHLKRGVPAVCDALFTFGELVTNKHTPSKNITSGSPSPRRAQVKEQEWYATSLALTQHNSSSRYDALASGAYLVLGFHSGLVQLYRLDTHWFSSTHFSSTRVQPACGRHVIWSALCHSAPVTRIIVTEPAHLVLTASEDGRVGVRHLSRLDALLFMLGDGSLPRSMASLRRPQGATSSSNSNAQHVHVSSSRDESGDGLMKETVGHTKRITCMCWLAEPHLLITGGMDHCLFYWTTRSARPSRRINLRDMQASIPALARLGACGYPIDLSCMQRPGDPPCLVVLDQRRVIRFLHALTGQFAAVLVDMSTSSLGLGDMLVARYDAQEDRLLLGARCLRVWEMARDQTYSRDYAGHKQPVLFLGWSPALRLFVSADEDQIVTWALVVESRHAEGVARMRRLQKLRQKQHRQQQRLRMLEAGAVEGDAAAAVDMLESDPSDEDDEYDDGNNEMDMSSVSLSPITGLPRVSPWHAPGMITEGNKQENTHSHTSRTHSPSSSSRSSSRSSSSLASSTSSSSSLALSSLQDGESEQQQQRQGVSWTTEWQPQRSGRPLSPTTQNSSVIAKKQQTVSTKSESLLTQLPELVFSQDRDVNVYNHSMWRSRTRLVRAWPVTAGVRAVAMNEQDHISPGIFVALLREDAIVQYNGFNGAALRRFGFASGAQDLIGLCAAEAASAARANQLHRSLHNRTGSVVSSSSGMTTSITMMSAQTTTTAKGNSLSLSHGSSGAGSASNNSSSANSALAMSCAPVLLAAYEEGGRSGLASVYPLLPSQSETTTTSNTTQQQESSSSSSAAQTSTTDPLRRPHRTVRVRESVIAGVTVVPALDALVCGGRGRLYVTPVNGLTNVAAPCRTLREQAAAMNADASATGMSRVGAARRVSPPSTAYVHKAITTEGAESDSTLELVALFPGHLVPQPRGLLLTSKKDNAPCEEVTQENNTSEDQNFFTTAQAATAGYIGHLCPVPQTTYVISGSNDGLIQVWNIHTYAELLRFRVTLCEGDTITALHLHRMSNQTITTSSRSASRGPGPHSTRSSSMPNASLSMPTQQQQQVYRPAMSNDGFTAFNASHAGMMCVDDDSDGQELWSCEGQRHRYALAVGDASGYMSLFDLSHIPWEGGVALDVLPLARLTQQVVLLDRWRAHRQDIRSIRLVNSPEVVGLPRNMGVLSDTSTKSINASSEKDAYSMHKTPRTIRTPREADMDATGSKTVKPYDEPLARPTTTNTTITSTGVSAALLSSVLTIVTASEDSYIYIWRWERGLLHCLGCMGGGNESLVSPPLRQPMTHALTLFAQAREHYIWHRLICEQGFFLTAPLPNASDTNSGRVEAVGRFKRSAGGGPSRLRHRLRSWEVDAAVAFMSREVHALMSTNAVWQLATWGSLSCRSLAEEAELRARRYAQRTTTTTTMMSDARRESVVSGETASGQMRGRWQTGKETRSCGQSVGHRNSSIGSNSVRSLPVRSRSQRTRRGSSSSGVDAAADYAVFDEAGLPYLHWTSHTSSHTTSTTTTMMPLRRTSTGSSNNSEVNDPSIVKQPSCRSPSPTAPANATAVVRSTSFHRHEMPVLSSYSPYVFAFMSAYHNEDSVRACLQHSLEQLYPTLRQRVKDEVNKRLTRTSSATPAMADASVHTTRRGSSVTISKVEPQSVQIATPVDEATNKEEQDGLPHTPQQNIAASSPPLTQEAAVAVQEQLQGTMKGTNYGIEHALRATPPPPNTITSSNIGITVPQRKDTPLPTSDENIANRSKAPSSPKPTQEITTTADNRHGSFASVSSGLPRVASFSRITTDQQADMHNATTTNSNNGNNDSRMNDVVSSVCSTSVSQLADTGHPRSFYGASTNSTRPASGLHSLHDPLHATQRPLNSTSVSLLVSTAQGEESNSDNNNYSSNKQAACMAMTSVVKSSKGNDDTTRAMALAQPMQAQSSSLLARVPQAPATTPLLNMYTSNTRQSSTDSDSGLTAVSPATRSALVTLHDDTLPGIAGATSEQTFSTYRVAYDTNLPLVRVSSANKSAESTNTTHAPHSAHSTRLPSIISASALRRSRRESSRAASARKSSRARSATSGGAASATSVPASRRGTAFAHGNNVTVETSHSAEKKGDDAEREEDSESDLALRRGAAAVMHMAYLHRKREEALQKLVVMHNALTSSTNNNHQRRSPSWIAVQQQQKNKLEAVLEAGVLGLATYKDFSDTGTSTVFFGAERALLEVRRGRRARVSESFLRRVFSREEQAEDNEKKARTEVNEGDDAASHTSNPPNEAEEDAHENDIVKLEEVDDWYSAREKQRCRRRRDEALWNSERVMRTLMDWQAPLPDTTHSPALLPSLTTLKDTTATTTTSTASQGNTNNGDGTTTINVSTKNESVSALPAHLAALQAVHGEELQWMMNSTLNATLTEALMQHRQPTPVWQLPDFLPVTLTPSEPLVQPTVIPVLPPITEPTATTTNTMQGEEERQEDDKQNTINELLVTSTANANTSVREAEGSARQPGLRAGQAWRLYMAAQNYADTHAAQNPQHRITALVAAQVAQIESEMQAAVRTNTITIARRMSLSTASNATSEAMSLSHAVHAGRQTRRTNHLSSNTIHVRPSVSRVDEERDEDNNSRSTPSVQEDMTMMKRHGAGRMPKSHSHASSQAAAATTSNAVGQGSAVRTLPLNELRRTRVRQPPTTTTTASQR